MINTATKLESAGEAKPVTLREKFAEIEDLRKNFVVSFEVINIVGMVIFWYSTILIPIYQFVFILPVLTESWREYLINVAFILFISLECAINWIQCWYLHPDIVVCTDCKARGMPSVAPSRLETYSGRQVCNKWTYCAQCQSDVPPRSYHCKVCKVCVLKRDHHCFFVGRCIGFHSQRRFIVLIFYLLIANSYIVSSFSAFLATWIPLFPVSVWSMSAYIIPTTVVNFFLFSEVKFFFLICLIHLYLYIGLVFLTLFYVLWEAALVFSGQTTYEAGHGVNRYRVGFINSWYSVFGNYGLVHFIWPINTQKWGDGFNWPIGKVIKNL